MKILVTGGAGFIGVNLIQHLIANSSHQIVNVDKLSYAANPRSLVEIGNSDRYWFIKADIVDAARMLSIFEEVQPEAVIHLAAESHVDRSIQTPERFVETNIVGTSNLLQASLQHFQSLPEAGKTRFRFVHISTDEVYGSLGSTGMFQESTPYDPHSPYAATKAAADHLVRSWHATYGLPTVVTNCCNNFGPYQFPEKLLPLMILNCLMEKPLPIYGTGENIRDWLYVEDHARALLTVLEQGKSGQTYNIGAGNEYSNIDLIQRVCQILDEIRPRPSGGSYAQLITFVEDRPGHDFRYAIDASKIKRELSWSPRFSFDESLRMTIQWYLNHRTWWQSLLDE